MVWRNNPQNMFPTVSATSAISCTIVLCLSSLGCVLLSSMNLTILARLLFDWDTLYGPQCIWLLPLFSCMWLWCKYSSYSWIYCSSYILFSPTHTLLWCSAFCVVLSLRCYFLCWWSVDLSFGCFYSSLCSIVCSISWLKLLCLVTVFSMKIGGMQPQFLSAFVVSVIQ